MDIVFCLVSDHDLLAILSRGYVCSRFLFPLIVYFSLVLTSDLDPGSGAVTLKLYIIRNLIINMKLLTLALVLPLAGIVKL